MQIYKKNDYQKETIDFIQQWHITLIIHGSKDINDVKHSYFK